MSANKYEEPCPCCGVIEWSRGRKFEQERIIKLLEGEMCEKDEELVECWCGSWLEAIALIKGENKTNLWTSRPLTEEDIEHYGLEGENK